MSTSDQLNFTAEVLTEEEKQAIINAAKGEYKKSVKEQSVKAVLVHGKFYYGKPPSFYSSWASGTTGHWGIVAYGFLHHLVISLDDDRKPAGIDFKIENFKQAWINEEKVTKMEEIGSTSLPLDVILAVGKTIILDRRL